MDDAAKNIAKVNAIKEKFKMALRKLPKELGHEAINFALDNFRRQGFLGDTIQPWKKRKNPTKWGKVKSPNRNLLVKTGTLRRGFYIKEATPEKIVIGNNVPYAKVHNDGLRVGEIQKVKPFKRMQKLGGIASTFGAGRQFKTGAHMSISKRRNLKPVGVKTEVQVKGFDRRINQNIPARPFLKNSPYLMQRMKRITSAEIMKALKS